jgi:hypothetical protein
LAQFGIGCSQLVKDFPDRGLLPAVIRLTSSKRQGHDSARDAKFVVLER